MVVGKVVATHNSERVLLPLITFRWFLWVLVLALLSLDGRIRSSQSVLAVLLIALAAVYTFVWSLKLASFASSATRQPALLTGDLVISLLPASLTGGWSSPFLPLALGALILPGVLFHWRGSLLAIAAYLVADQIIGWSIWRPGLQLPLASPWGLLHYLLAVIAATSWPLALQLWRWRTRRSARGGSAITLPARHRGSTTTGRVQTVEQPVETMRSGSGAGTATALSVARTRPQTLEHPPALELYAAIRHAVAEAEEQGLKVDLVFDGTELVLPQDQIQLLAKAVEVGLDNTLRHARTCEAEVTAVTEGQNILLTVRDHGPGLLDGTAEPPGFHQLRRLRYRLAEVEGILDVRDDDTGGVLLTVRIPLNS